MPTPARINKRHATDRLRTDYAHTGLFDTNNRGLWIARRRFNVTPIRVSHARLLIGGSDDTGVAEKDRFLCYWYHTPHTGSGLLHGYPIEWEEAHLMVRLDPTWDHRNQKLLRPTADPHRVERNREQQYRWGQLIFEAYAALGPRFPLSWHLIGPRPADSMFYIRRIEATRY